MNKRREGWDYVKTRPGQIIIQCKMHRTFYCNRYHINSKLCWMTRCNKIIKFHTTSTPPHKSWIIMITVCFGYKKCKLFFLNEDFIASNHTFILLLKSCTRWAARFLNNNMKNDKREHVISLILILIFVFLSV